MMIVLVLLLTMYTTYASPGTNYCVMYHHPSDLTKKCEGTVEYVSRNYTNLCEYDPCPELGTNPASVGDSYKGLGQCWDHPQWYGTRNTINSGRVSIGETPDYYPECWWFGPDRVLNYSTVTGVPHCNIFADEDEKIACFCHHPIWDHGTISNDDGVSMVDACCACGGGTDWDPENGPPTDSPTDPPTDPPTASPTRYVPLDGQIKYSLRFIEAYYTPRIHQSYEFINILKIAIAAEMEVLLEHVHIASIRSGSVIVDFYLSEETIHNVRDKKDAIVHRVSDLTHDGSTTTQYYGLSIASIDTAAVSTESDSDSGNTGVSVGIGIAIAFSFGIVFWIGSVLYDRRKNPTVRSKFVFNSQR